MMFAEFDSVVVETETVKQRSSSRPYPSHMSKANQLEKKGKMPLLQQEAAKCL